MLIQIIVCLSVITGRTSCVLVYRNVSIETCSHKWNFLDSALPIFLPLFDVYDETPAIPSAQAGDKLFTDGTSPVDLFEYVVTGVRVVHHT